MLETNKFNSVAFDHVAQSVASLDDRVAEIIKTGAIMQAYKDEFITLVALAGEKPAFKVQEDLKKAFPKDFKIPEFKKWVKERCLALKPVAVMPKGEPEWKRELMRSEKGAPLAILANAITAIRGAGWELCYDEFANGTFTSTGTPWNQTARPWADEDDIRAAEWLQRAFVTVNREIAAQAIEVVGRERSFHPVREYLNSLKWDGTVRLTTWLARHIGVKPNPYVSAVGQCWMISAVARVFQPGCKADHMLILEGPQGARKSTALKTLAHPWFADEISDFGSKDAAMQTRSVWILEIAELDAMSRAEAGRIKGFMSRSTDHYRPPYGKRVVDIARQCIFAGSVNHDTYLKDEGGARRFWPVKCGHIDIESLTAERDQLWAEALVRYQDGDQWWLPEHLKPAAEAQQSKRYDGDAWDSVITSWAAKQVGSVSVSEVLNLCFEKPTGQWSKADEMRVSRCLVAAGWKKYRARFNGARQWRYHSPESEIPADAETEE